MKLACVFPGQGSQSINMLATLAEKYSMVTKLFDQASAVLDVDLWQIVQQGPVEKLNKTEITQPAMLVAGYAVWKLLEQEKKVAPDFFAGHSLGEYTALLCAGAIKFEEAVDLVSQRGKFMQQAVAEGEGAMAAILGLDNEQVVSACERSAKEEVVAAVNFNSPGQVVIAGHKNAVKQAIEECKLSGAKRAILLPVSVPSHCSLMKPAADKLAKKLQEVEISVPRIPVIHNYSVEISTQVDSIRDALVKQLYYPVRWSEIIVKLKEASTDLILECGPGKVLTGLCKRIDRTINAKAVFDAETLMSVTE